MLITVHLFFGMGWEGGGAGVIRILLSFKDILVNVLSPQLTFILPFPL